MENKHIEDILHKFKIDAEENLIYRLDSVRIIELIMEIETLLNIEINDIDLKKHNSVKKIIDEFSNRKQ